jgi:hypothetical protein
MGNTPVLTSGKPGPMPARNLALQQPARSHAFLFHTSSNTASCSLRGQNMLDLHGARE